MNWPKKKLFSLTILAIMFWIAGCGVKGDPLPPEKPTELGRGRPTYKRATEGIPIEKSKEEEEGEDDGEN